jgi:hypothetical protein
MLSIKAASFIWYSIFCCCSLRIFKVAVPVELADAQLAVVDSDMWPDGLVTTGIKYYVCIIHSLRFSYWGLCGVLINSCGSHFWADHLILSLCRGATLSNRQRREAAMQAWEGTGRSRNCHQSTTFLPRTRYWVHNSIEYYLNIRCYHLIPYGLAGSRATHTVALPASRVPAPYAITKGQLPRWRICVCP